MGTPPILTENDLEKLWSRWTNLDVPKSLVKRSEEITNPIRDSLLELVEAKLGNASKQDYQKEGELFGYLIAWSARACFMIGLEYAAQHHNIRDEKQFHSEMPPEAVDFLKVAIQGPAVYIVALTNELQKMGGLPKAQIDRARSRLADMLARAQFECYKLGVQYSPLKQRNLRT
jgi:hypothetical protein